LADDRAFFVEKNAADAGIRLRFDARLPGEIERLRHGLDISIHGIVNSQFFKFKFDSDLARISADPSIQSVCRKVYSCLASKFRLAPN
jgi:hypothetical protein